MLFPAVKRAEVLTQRQSTGNLSVKQTITWNIYVEGKSVEPVAHVHDAVIIRSCCPNGLN